MAMVTSNIRDASFSSYLSTNEETFLRKLADQKSNQNLSPIITTASASQGDKQNHLGTRKKEEEEEIGVFGAEKYFNGVMDEESSKSSSSTCSSRKYHVHQQQVNLDHMKLKIHQPGTPSVRSESSWNSQSALLRSGSRNPNRTNKASNKAQMKSFFASLGCKCSCSDKNSVDVKEEHVGEISFKHNAGDGGGGGGAAANSGITTPHIKQSLDLVGEALVKIKQTPESWVKEEILMNKEKLDKPGTGLSRENCFTFPASKPGVVSNLPIKMPTFEEIEEEKLRKSIEQMLSQTVMQVQTCLRLRASQGKNNPFLARQASDGCATPTTCYAPSEVSIDWSVATASAADFSSAMSDCEDLVRSSPTKTSRMNKDMVPIRHRSAVLLGCKSQKAVKVAANAHRPYNQKTNLDPQMTPHKPEMPFMPSTRFQAETTTKLTGFDTRLQGQHALAPRPLPRSHSPHASHLLFTQ
ncbi:hypothetical protein M0R45_022270 [Rubus argutus]|uniref:Uncharacterized protein n=1 Tax=Rubus argutus TaxID=59490 RepID=A0AAW1XGP6_RUBAR